MKIDEEDFKDENGNFYRWVADLFIYTAIAELSGPERIVFVDEANAKYKLNFDGNKTKNDEKRKVCAIAMNIRPYRVLPSIDA